MLLVRILFTVEADVFSNNVGYHYRNKRVYRGVNCGLLEGHN